jgi:hypothetical protein
MNIDTILDYIMYGSFAIAGAIILFALIQKWRGKR